MGKAFHDETQSRQVERFWLGRLLAPEAGRDGAVAQMLATSRQ
jgi:hypothetical protein